MNDPYLLTEVEITKCLLQGRKTHPSPDPDQLPVGAKPASVLIPLQQVQGDFARSEWHVLLTLRTERVADHKGQVSFPGGRADEGDVSPEATALREAFEEIGLKPVDVRLAGNLEPVVTNTNYLITPVVGFIPWPYQFTLESEEVSRVFSIPLSWLTNPANHEIRERNLTTNYGFSRSLKVIFFKPYNGETLWGVSAEITMRLLSKLSVIT